MKAILLKELKQRRWSLVAYCLAALGFLWLYISLFPYLQEQSQNYMKMFEAFPKAFMDAFGLEGDFFLNVQGYMASEMYTLIWPLLTIFLLLSHAGSAIAGEIETLTIGSLLAQPVSRARLYIVKYVSGVIRLVIFVTATVLTCMPIASIYHLAYQPSHFFTFSLLALLFGLVIYSFAFMLSAIFNEKSHVYFATGGVLFGMYVLNVISALKPALKNLKYASIFHYYNPGDALIRNHIDPLALLIFAGGSFLFFAVGLSLFNKRDISI